MRKCIFLFVLSLILLSVGCSSDDTPPFPSWGVEPTTVRLKHLLTTSEVVEALGGYTEGWDVGELDVTNLGSYPKMPYVYYYSLSMKIETAGERTQYRSVKAEAGGPVEADVTLDQFLQENVDYIAIDHPELDRYPRTYIVKKNDNDDKAWRFDLYTPHIRKSGNKTMHSIYLQGGNTPVLTDGEAVTVLLSLVEKHD